MENEGDKKTVFVVDDDDFIRYLLEESLLTKNYQVFSFKDGWEVKEALENGQKPPNFLITDFQMPRLNGLDLSKSVKSTYPKVFIIMVTFSQPPDKNPVNRFIKKSYYNFQETINEIEKEMERALVALVI